VLTRAPIPEDYTDDDPLVGAVSYLVEKTGITPGTARHWLTEHQVPRFRGAGRRATARRSDLNRVITLKLRGQCDA